MNQWQRHDIDRIYEEILAWHRVHDDDNDNCQTRRGSIGAGEEWTRTMRAARAQRAAVPRRLPQGEQTTDAASTILNNNNTANDIEVPPVITSRPGSFKGSLKEKVTKLRRSSVASLKDLFDNK